MKLLNWAKKKIHRCRWKEKRLERNGRHGLIYYHFRHCRCGRWQAEHCGPLGDRKWHDGLEGLPDWEKKVVANLLDQNNYPPTPTESRK